MQMKLCVLRKVIVLTALLLVLFSQSAWAERVRKLDAPKAYAMLQQDQAVFLLDVRTLREYQNVRLADARLIPIDQLPARQSELPRDRPILVYCEVGQRSAQVAAYLAGQGFPAVFDLQGGIWGWQLRNLPVLKGLP